jgi:putative endonuclease
LSGAEITGTEIPLAERSRSQKPKPEAEAIAMKGYMYILECSDGSYYTGSTTHLELRFAQHQSGEGANHTRKHLPVKLLYYEEFDRIDKAFEREKQVQGLSRKKKEALISNNMEELHLLSVCSNKTHYSYGDFDSADFGSAQSPELKSPENTPPE